MSEFWTWWDGKKTIIGTVCLWIGYAVIGDLLMGQLAFNPEWLATVQSILTWIGTFLAPLGLAHKVAKG